jgi:hypothetical protein
MQFRLYAGRDGFGGEPQEPTVLAGAQPGEQDLRRAWVAVSLPIDHRGDEYVGAAVAVEIRTNEESLIVLGRPTRWGAIRAVSVPITQPRDPTRLPGPLRLSPVDLPVKHPPPA